MGDDICRCGHDRSAHQHYRGGTECALCASDACSRYRPDTPFRRAVDTVLDRLPGRRS